MIIFKREKKWCSIHRRMREKKLNDDDPFTPYIWKRNYGGVCWFQHELKQTKMRSYKIKKEVK